jgi:hypothetical protein
MAEWRADAAIAPGDVVSLRAHAIMRQFDTFNADTGMAFVADIAPAARAGMWVDVVREARGRPLLWHCGCATDVAREAGRRIAQMCRAWLMFVARKVVQAERTPTRWAARHRLYATLAARGDSDWKICRHARSPLVPYDAAHTCRSVSITARAGLVKRVGPPGVSSRRRRVEPRRRVSRGGVDALDGFRLLQAIVQRDERRGVVANAAAEALDL